MADQPRIAAASETQTRKFSPKGANFPPKGVPVIHRVNRLGLWTLYMKEVRRFSNVQTKTSSAPAAKGSARPHSRSASSARPSASRASPR